MMLEMPRRRYWLGGPPEGTGSRRQGQNCAKHSVEQGQTVDLSLMLHLPRRAGLYKIATTVTHHCEKREPLFGRLRPKSLSMSQ